MFRLGIQGFVLEKCKRAPGFDPNPIPYEARKAHSIFCFLFFQDPFLVISKATENGTLVPICKTEVLKNDHDPKWKQFLLSIQQVGSKVPKISARKVTVSVEFLLNIFWMEISSKLVV